MSLGVLLRALALASSFGLSPSPSAAAAIAAAPRRAVAAVVSGTASRRSLLGSVVAAAVVPARSHAVALEDRDRGLNEGALIASDFYFVTGRRPPRVLEIDKLPAEDPKWNAWGECAKDSNGGNACTYIPLKQRYDAYSKYAATVKAGAEDFVELGTALKKRDASACEYLLDAGGQGRSPGAARSAARKALLLADGLLISSNSGSLGRPILVARFYANEIYYSTEAISKLLLESASDVDWAAATEAWRLGADSYNSFYTVVNPQIAPKVGDKFVPIKT